MLKKSTITGVLVVSAVAIITASCTAQKAATDKADPAAITEKTPGAIKAVKLMGSWVKAGAPNGAFTYKDLSGNDTKASFDGDIMPLMTEDNIWGDDTAACASCHSGNTLESLHELDLTSYKGMMIGADAISNPNDTARLFGESKQFATDYSWGGSVLRHRLRNNRMPPGLEFDISMENRNGPCVEVGSNGAKIIADKYNCKTTTVKMFGAWAEAGAPKDGTIDYGGGKISFAGDILPLMTMENVWGPDTASCISCHSGNTLESLHELDLTSHKGMMIGADAVSNPNDTARLFGESKQFGADYSWGGSVLRHRLRNNRMPPGLEFDISMENRNGPIVVHGVRQK